VAALLGVLAALAAVLGVLFVAMGALRRYVQPQRRAGTRLPLEVVQRLPLGPKQSLALVRIGDRVAALSVGEGGVRTLLELSEAESRAFVEPPADDASLAAPVFATELRKRLLAAVRTAALVALCALPLAAALPAVPAAAQEVAQASASAPVAAARADSLLTRLAPRMDMQLGGGAGQEGLRLSGTVGVVVMMGLLTLLPTLLLLTTSFTRILIVLHFVRQALGTQTVPPAHLTTALALLLTGFVMAPTFGEVNRTALQPWMDGQIEQGEMLRAASAPLRDFMLSHTRERDLETFVEMSSLERPAGPEDVSLVVLMSAFVTSELRTAFQIGFALFLPFIIIDIVVSSVLMSMGMFMLPPAMISLPFKLLLFVLVDGWALLFQTLVASFQ
jgi:flagellar biosynthetic protein FliP